MSTTTPFYDPARVQVLVYFHYVTVSVYVALLLEHLASLPQEVEHMWKAPLNFARICFLFYRYATVLGLSLLMYLLAGLSGFLSEEFCKHALAILAALSVTTMGIADVLVTLRVAVLWGRQRFILIISLISFLVTFSTTVVCIAIVTKRLNSHLVPGTNLNDCHFPSRPDEIFGVWIPGMVFDSLMLLLTTCNACARPRTKDTPFITALYQDGVAVFLILAGLRAINLFMSIFSQIFLMGICIVWPLSAITLSRFIFNLHQLEKAQVSASESSRMEFEDAYTDSKSSNMDVP